jgi:hypothetical protein
VVTRTPLNVTFIRTLPVLFTFIVAHVLCVCLQASNFVCLLFPGSYESRLEVLKMGCEHASEFVSKGSRVTDRQFSVNLP